MINCPKCNEVIGDDVRECPFCRHEITEEKRKNIAEEKELANWEATRAAMEEYSRRIRNGLIASAIWVVTTFAVIMLAIFCHLETFWFVLIFVLVGAAYFVSMHKLHFGQCPYCE